MTTNKIYLVLAAAGSSTRMGLGKKKEYLQLGQGTVLSQSLNAFLEASKKSFSFENIIITIPKNNQNQAKKALLKDNKLSQILDSIPYTFVEGGNSRQNSVFKALEYINSLIKNDSLEEQKNTIVLIHDAARPFVTKQIIQDVVSYTIKYGAAVPAIPVVDTQKIITEQKEIQTHLQRSSLAAVQTPQGFYFQKLFDCHKQALNIQKEFTDDTEIWDAFPKITNNQKVHVVSGDINNKKITYAKDINPSMTHIGIGTDLHKLVEGRKLYLGGIEIPSDKGELAHSDGDVLLHSITDALLGASGLGDIGSYFPPEDNKWKDADSAELLKTVWNDIKQKGWHLVNLDCVIELEKPKFLPWRQKVIHSVSSILEVNADQVFVKAKTNEKLDSVGQEQAVKAYSVCLLER